MSATTRTPEIVLRVENVVKRFGGITAVDGASFEVPKGRITGVIGPNGSGKSTMFNLITGVDEADSGTITYRDKNVVGLKSDAVNRLGLGRTFQLTRLFGTMTVVENLTVVTQESAAIAEKKAVELLENLGLVRLRNEYAMNLSYGQQKLIEFLRLSMIDTDLILLDEPFAGVNPIMEKKLLEQIDVWITEGKTILLTDHEMAIMMEICDHMYVFNYGSVIASGTPSEVRDNPLVMEAYFGT